MLVISNHEEYERQRIGLAAFTTHALASSPSAGSLSSGFMASPSSTVTTTNIEHGMKKLGLTAEHLHHQLQVYQHHLILLSSRLDIVAPLHRI
jgi:hypothetical protein